MAPVPRIMIVDDEDWNLKVLESQLKPLGYEVITARGAEEAFQRISENPVDLVLSDVMMPGKDGFTLCRQIKNERSLRSIPVILVTALQETPDKVKGLEAGAADFISKPVNKAELTARVRAHLRIKSLVDEVEFWNRTLEQKVKERTREIQEKNAQLDESYFLTLEALISALDIREHETGKHSLRVAFYTTELAKKAGIKGRDLEEMAMGALLHDIGKIGTPDQILLKPGKLTEEEWVEMRRHPWVGWNMVKDIEFIGRGRDLILAHQERYDGSGYPCQLKGEAIFPGARFFAVADVYDALRSKRSYKEEYSYAESRQIIREGSGIHFDPSIADLFLSISETDWDRIKALVEHSNFKSLMMQIRNAASE